MDKELDKYYTDRFSLFAEQGWKDLIEDIQLRIDAIQSIKNVPNLEALLKRQGELECLEWLKDLPELSKRVYEELTDERELK